MGLGVVGLYWDDSTTFPVGVYRCEIPDASGIKRTLFVGIYTSEHDSTKVAGVVVGVLLALVLVGAVSALIVILQWRR